MELSTFFNKSKTGQLAEQEIIKTMIEEREELINERERIAQSATKQCDPLMEELEMIKANEADIKIELDNVKQKRFAIESELSSISGRREREINKIDKRLITEAPDELKNFIDEFTMATDKARTSSSKDFLPMKETRDNITRLLTSSCKDLENTLNELTQDVRNWRKHKV